MNEPPLINHSSNSTIELLLEQARNSFRNFQDIDTEEICQSILQLEPNHPEPHYLLGLLAIRRKHAEASLTHFETAIDQNPTHGPYWLAYIDALDQAGQTDSARQTLEMAQQAGLTGQEAAILATRLNEGINQKTTSKPDDNDALLSLYTQCNFSDCEHLALHLLDNFPENGFTWKILGAALQQQNLNQEAIFAMQQAVLLLPNDPDAHNNLGVTLKSTGDLKGSEISLHQAITLREDFAEAHNNLGVTLMALGRLSESEECLHRALELQPDYTEAYCNLGINLRDQGRLSEAARSFQKTLDLNPSFAEAYNNLANLLLGQGRLSDAEAHLHKALELKPDFAIAWNNLANTLHCQGRLTESQHCYEKALALKPDYAEAFDGLLFASNYHPDASIDDIFQLYREYDKHFGLPLRSQWKPHTNSRNTQRRLKIGYVSPAFYSHPVFHFLEPLLAHHDKSKFEIFAYSETIREDQATLSCKQYVDHWIPTIGLSDDALAQQIRDDGIDILIDLAGHTGRNRLGVFARKPTPVSLHWLDFGYTTGLSAIDYYLTDINNAPIGSDHLFAEQLWRLPAPAIVYRPAPGMGEINSLPALSREYVTFGTLSRAIRINHRTIRVWSETLHRVKGSRLIIDSGNFKDQTTQDALKAQFAAHGIENHRLLIGYHSPPWDVLRDMDICLDCFPHNSGTTLLESLYMGIPFITMADRPAIGRLGCTILEGAGQSEWIARTEEEYIEKAVTLAADLPRLSAIRTNLRNELQKSPLMDEQGFTKMIEEAYQQMFQQWSTTSLSAISQIKDNTLTVNNRVSAANDTAIHYYNLGVQHQIENRLSEAKKEYIQAINLHCTFTEATNNLGVIFQQEGKFHDAVACFLGTLALRPDYTDAWYNLGNTYKIRQILLKAEEAYRKTLLLKPDHINALYNLGNNLQEQGRHEEAEACLRQVLSLDPNHLNAFSTLLFTLNYHPDKNQKVIFQAYEDANSRFFLPHHTAWQPHTNTPLKNRRLRVGYVAPDYRRHPSQYFLRPLLAHHDRSVVDLYAYVHLSEDESKDDLFSEYVAHWVSTRGMTDDQLSERIRNDSIDVLIDLAGHTANNRLGVFARKPAPVSLHWLDSGYTTGLTAIDYYLTDKISVPAESEQFFSEKPWYLASPSFAYRPPEQTGDVNTLPALQNGFITFGTLTRAVRINHHTIQVWSEILKKCKGSRLIINSSSYREPGIQNALAAHFAQHGIERNRLDIGATSPPWDILRKVDIGLDCFPHNSGTTLVESLYMGVPYITLAGRPSVGRIGSSILTGIGRPEWIAASEEEYIRKAVSLAANSQKLAGTRLSLREDMEKSPLMDEVCFTRQIESAFKEMFQKWEETLLPTLSVSATNISNAIIIKNNRKERGQKKTSSSKTTHSASPSPSELQLLARLFTHGNKDEALSLATYLTKQFPRHGFAWKVLGPLLYNHGMKKEAIEAMRTASECCPDDAEAHANLGIALEQTSLLAEAEQSYKLALRCDKKHIQSHYNLANILKKQNRLTEAEAEYKLALKLKPDFFEAACNLGNVLKSQNRLTEAETYYKQALKLKIDAPEVYYNLGNTLRLQGRLPEAIKYFFQALKLNPELTKAYNNLGVCFKEQGLFSQAEAVYHKAIKLNPHYADAYSNMGSLASLQGRINEAEGYLAHALELSPDQVKIHSNFLFTINYHPDKSGKEIFQYYKNFNVRFGLPLQKEWQFNGNSRETHRRLKIGYVCPQFCQHPNQYFLEPLLANHDKQKVEIFAYADISKGDAVTHRYKTYADHWIDTTTLNDLELTQRIRKDNIDILIDIAGHTGNNRLLVFARKPAPISLHWLDFGYTTGLTAIDYYLTDIATVPADSEDLFSETPWRIETPCLAYRPPSDTGAVNTLPAASKGYITFGTLTRAVRINYRSIRVWSEILKKVTNSKLIINSGSFQDPVMVQEFADKFVSQGIDRDRLEIGYQSPPWDVLGQIDISLDCFPHNSGTTLLESLYMGVPFITLAGRPSVGRLGCSILEGVGHSEWIARSEEEYIEKAVTLASHLPNLAAIRTSLRQEMKHSSLMDELGFTRKVEKAYEEMFSLWRKDTQTLSSQSVVKEIAGSLQLDHSLGENEISCQAGHSESAVQLFELAEKAGLAKDEVGTLKDPLTASLSEVSAQQSLPSTPITVTRSSAQATQEDISTQFEAKSHEPDPAETNRLISLYQEGKYAESETLAQSLIKHYPDNSFAWKALGFTLKTQGRLDDAIWALQQSLERTTNDMETLCNLGDVLHTQGRFEEAETIFRRSLELDPKSPVIHYAFANSLFELGKLQEAEASYKRAIHLKPDFAEAFSNLGNIFQSQDKSSKAKQSYQRALEIKPDFAEASFNLGNLFRKENQFEEALQKYQWAIRIRPDYYKAYNNLGICFQMQGQLSEAENNYRKTIAIQPDFVDGHINLGACLKEQGLYLAAEQSYLKALAILPDFALCYSNLGSVLKDQGRLSEAEECLRQALKLSPNFAETHSNLLFLLNYDPDKSPEEIFQEYKNFDSRFGLPLQTDWLPHTNTCLSSRRLNVGYVSSQFHLHSIRHFLEPLLAHHDKLHFEIFAYADNATEDIQTNRYKSYVDHWRTTTRLSDSELASQIRSDRIDILVDLAGHTVGNRMQMFARKPAPISLHWLDFGYTTGLSAINYYLTDQATVPEGSGGLFSETPWRLKTPSFAYRPAEGMGDVPPLPAITQGHITFGVLSRMVRINHRTIRVWSEILKRVKGSHLVINSGNFKDSAMQDMLAEKFVAHGINRDRLEIGYTSPPWDVLRGLDIGLDCFPHNSGTTLIETLYMGVPFITLASRPSVGRIGCSILEGVGQPEWIAQTEDEYVDLAVALATNLPHLAELRANLRPRMNESPLMDEPGFTLKVETAYKEMFTKWCASQQVEPSEIESIPPTSLLAIQHEAEIFYQAGQFSEAEALYLSILKTDPLHSETNYRMGCMAVSRQQPAIALPYFAATLDIHPEHGPYWLAYIDALDRANQPESALQLLEMAIQAGLDGKEMEALKNRLASVPDKIAHDIATKTNPVTTKKHKLKRKEALKKHPATPHPDEINRLTTLFQQGNLIEAESAAHALIKCFPTHNLGWKVLGAIRRQQGALQEALSAMEHALSAMPKDYICLRNIAVLLCDLGRYSEAEKYCRRAIAMNPDYADAHNTLSIALKSQNKLPAAEQSCRKALKLHPDSAENFVNLGLILNEGKQFSEAESCFHKALKLNPHFAEAYCGLGITFQASKMILEAKSACHQALTLKPDYAAAYNLQGSILNEQKKYPEAETAYRQALKLKPDYFEALHNLGKTFSCQGNFAEAELCYKQFFKNKPDNAEVCFNLGTAFDGQDKHEEAKASYKKALELQPDYPEALMNLGNSLRAQGRIIDAESCYRTILRTHPENSNAYNNLGNILQEQGRLIESEVIFRSVLESKPHFPDAFGNLLFLLNYHPDITQKEIFQEYVKFDERFGLPLRAEWKSHDNNRSLNRRLKIGYVSPQFCQHPVCNFLEPLLACHNKEQVELYAYAELYKEDSTTDRYRTYMDHWIPTKGMSDSDMAEHIRADGIDILVDLAGHTGQNRLLVFARKPAPISLHWLDFGYTTGLTAIDYYLTDNATIPPGSEVFFSEKPWKMKTPALTYRPTEGMGEVNTLPAIKNGHITFGCLSRAVRINHKTIRVWSEILKQVKGSRLVINSGNFKDPDMQNQLTEKFAAHGITPDQLEIGYTSPPWDVLRSLDIGLDCFPHNSGTTLIETLYMGIPFITLANRPSVGRLGCSILEGLGHPEWIARSEEEYIERVVALAADLPGLNTLRTNLRQEMKQSPLMDESGFARKIETAYKEMFAKWCEEHK